MPRAPCLCTVTYSTLAYTIHTPNFPDAPLPKVRTANVSTVRMLMGRWGASVEASASGFLDLLRPGRRKQRGSETATGSSGAVAGGGGGAPPLKRSRQGSAGGGQAGGRMPDHQQWR